MHDVPEPEPEQPMELRHTAFEQFPLDGELNVLAQIDMLLVWS